MSHSMKRRITVLSSLIALILGANIAFAAWLSSGDGSGTASAGEAADPVVTTTAVTDLYPGATDDIVVNVTNPNAYDAEVISIDVTDVRVAAANGADATDACAPADLDVDSLTGLDVAVGNGEDADINLPVKLINDAANGCQGATFTVDVTATLQSAVQ